jgi:hypothetical protein
MRNVTGENAGFGYQGKRAGAKAAKDLKEGKISREEFRERYQTAIDAGLEDEFKEGYATESDKPLEASD